MNVKLKACKIGWPLALLFAFIFNFSPSFAESLWTACTVSKTNCQFYQCAEQKYNCGEDSYLKSFGYKYCQRFVNKQKSRRYSKVLDSWLTDVRVCLQEKILKQKNLRSCNHLTEFALNSHTPCYIKTGFCELYEGEQWEVLQLLSDSLKTKYSSKIFHQFLTINSICNRKYEEEDSR